MKLYYTLYCQIDMHTLKNSPAGAAVVFGAGSKLLRAAAGVLFDAWRTDRLAPLGASLDGSAALAVVGSSFPKFEPAGSQNHTN